jgi:hypothetical protein
VYDNCTRVWLRCDQLDAGHPIRVGSHDSVCWRPKYLTHAGNEFLSAAESDTVWNNAKSILWKSTKTVTLEGLKMALPLAVKALTGAQS